MTWRARYRARLRRRALARLLPGFTQQPQDSEEVILLALPVPTTQLIDPDTGRVDFHKRAEVCNYLGRRAQIEASKLVKDRYPVKFPDTMGNAFKEGWTSLPSDFEVRYGAR